MRDGIRIVQLLSLHSNTLFPPTESTAIALCPFQISLILVPEPRFPDSHRFSFCQVKRSEWAFNFPQSLGFLRNQIYFKDRQGIDGIRDACESVEEFISDLLTRVAKVRGYSVLSWLF